MKSVDQNVTFTLSHFRIDAIYSSEHQRAVTKIIIEDLDKNLDNIVIEEQEDGHVDHYLTKRDLKDKVIEIIFSKMSSLQEKIKLIK